MKHAEAGVVIYRGLALLASIVRIPSSQESRMGGSHEIIPDPALNLKLVQEHHPIAG
jgi:hypothetical protein